MTPDLNVPVETPQEPPEDSLALRIVVFLMSLICIISSCLFSHIEWYYTLMFLLALVTGSYLSYQHRHEEMKSLKWASFAGIIFIGGLTVYHMMGPLRDNFDFVSPFVLFFGGVFSFLTFEMKTRSDLNLSSGMGLILLCICAPVAKGITFGACVFAYMLLGAVMLYFDCVSRTMSAWLEKPMMDAPEIPVAGKVVRSNRGGTTLLSMALLPLLALALFLFSPRMDDLIDRAMAFTKSLDPNYVLDAVVPPQRPAMRERKGQTGRDYFNKKNKDMMSKLKDREKQKKKEKQAADSDLPDDLSKTREKNKAAKKAKPQPPIPPTPPKQKGTDKAKKDKAKKSKKKSKNESAKAAAEKKKKKSKADTEKGEPGSKSKSKSKSKTAKGSGEGEGKGGGEGEGAGAGEGEGATGGGEGGAGGGESDFTLGGDEELDLSLPSTASDALVLLVKSRRLAYLRRQCYDNFTGRVWKKTLNSKKDKPVKVKNGELVKKKVKVKIPGYDRSKTAVTGKIPLMKAGQSLKNAGGQTGINLNVKKQEPQKVKQPAPLKEEKIGLGKERIFQFTQKERPLFKIGMADALQLPERYPSVELIQDVKVKAKSIGKVVPAAWIPSEIGIKNQKRLAVDKMGVVTADEPIERDKSFKVKTQLAMFELNSLRKMPPIGAIEEEEIRDAYSKYLQLPDTMSMDLFELAESNTNPAYNWFVQSEQISEHLRKNYKYDLYRVAGEDSEDLVQEFLFERKKGHCADFASAFVVLNRCIGIPTRLVSGFQPGGYNKVTGEREVRACDIHQWAEAYIPNYGWVPFDATPDGYLPAQKREKQYSIEEVQKDMGMTEEEAKQLTEKIIKFASGSLILLVLLALAVVALRILLKRILRWWRKRTPRGPEWRQYKKVIRSVKKSTRIRRELNETPGEFVERVTRELEEAKREGKVVPELLPEALDKFMSVYDAVYFGSKKDRIEDLKFHAEQVDKAGKAVKKFGSRVETDAVRK